MCYRRINHYYILLLCEHVDISSSETSSPTVIISFNKTRVWALEIFMVVQRRQGKNQQPWRYYITVGRRTGVGDRLYENFKELCFYNIQTTNQDTEAIAGIKIQPAKKFLDFRQSCAKYSLVTSV
jgi:hypothetical protein